MSPVNLGALPLTQPVPTGRGQIMYGSTNGTMNYNNTVGATPLTNGAGTPMRIAVTPPIDCWWRVTAYTIWSSPDAVWTRADWGVDLSPADKDGWSRTYALIWVNAGATGVWHHSRTTALYRLAGGVAYTATMMWIASPSGYNQQVWTGPDYHCINGHTIGEGRA